MESDCQVQAGNINIHQNDKICKVSRQLNQFCSWPHPPAPKMWWLWCFLMNKGVLVIWISWQYDRAMKFYMVGHFDMPNTSMVHTDQSEVCWNISSTASWKSIVGFSFIHLQIRILSWKYWFLNLLSMLILSDIKVQVIDMLEWLVNCFLKESEGNYYYELIWIMLL